MGDIKKVLAMAALEPRSLTARNIWTDLCENIHLHYRNTRFDFSEIEWAHFRSAVNACGVTLERIAEEKNYREGNPNFLIQQIFDLPVKSDSEYYPNRALIEANNDNTFHFHYRDVRLHFTSAEFRVIAGMFFKALSTLKSMEPFPYEGVKERLRKWVPIKLIQPYDEGHRPGVEITDHRDGINAVKKLMGDHGNVIRPILVNDKGKRLDGFKRFMAHVEMGKDEIECFIDPWGKPGGQHNHSFLDDRSKGDESET